MASTDEGRLSWLVGKVKQLTVGEGAASSSTTVPSSPTPALTLWQSFRAATGGGLCPYLEASDSPPQAGGEMRCPFAAAGSTELPPGHPMIPGMMNSERQASASTITLPGAAGKFLTVAKKGSCHTDDDRDAARLVLQAAARGMLARHACEGQRTTFGWKGARTTARLPTLTETLIRGDAVGFGGQKSDVSRVEYEMD